MAFRKPTVLLMGQTPPPWHGQAVATQLLFDHEWPGFEVHRLRMEYSEEMIEVGRIQLKKLVHLIHLVRAARRILRAHPDTVLFYPPASAKWVPFLRDVIFLALVRPLAGSTVFIFHASGLAAFSDGSLVRRILARLAYHRAEVSLEVSVEKVAPNRVFEAHASQWCPCAIEVPQRQRSPRGPGAPLEVLFVGSLQEGKGVLEILKTATLLKQRGHEHEFRFRLVGKWFSAAFEDTVRRSIASAKLEDMVELTGQLTGDDKWDAYYRADVFFFPTHYESEASPIVLMEALGTDLPVVTTRWAGIPAMLEGCASAHLLPVRSPESYADALLGLKSGEGLAPRGESLRFYQEHFLPERFIERVAGAFRQASGEHPRQGTRQTAETAPATRNPIRLSVYLADQNPGHDRSFGISRMSQVVIHALHKTGLVDIEALSSLTSQRSPGSVATTRVLPWSTRGKWMRLFSDHFHPLLHGLSDAPDAHYFPKGYLPLLHRFCQPSVVTIHDTIIQYDEDHYPSWRKPWEYAYWARQLKHTLERADRVMTVSRSSLQQIETFMRRHGIPEREITVTYEPCHYEEVPQPIDPVKEDFVMHLASCEPHKRTAHLVRWWIEAENEGIPLPLLHIIGKAPAEIGESIARSKRILRRPFLDDAQLQETYRSARALILPSEIEGFGLPALEAYYMGTPVCYANATSVEEILEPATRKGGFSLDDRSSLLRALDEVLAMTPAEVRECGLALRRVYSSQTVAQRMIEVFEEMRNDPRHLRTTP